MTGFLVTGFARLLLWDGTEQTITMTNYSIEENTPLHIWNKANNGNLPCQKILSINGVVYEKQEDKFIFVEPFNIDSELLMTYANA